MTPDSKFALAALISIIIFVVAAMFLAGRDSFNDKIDACSRSCGGKIVHFDADNGVCECAR